MELSQTDYDLVKSAKKPVLGFLLTHSKNAIEPHNTLTFTSEDRESFTARVRYTCKYYATNADPLNAFLEGESVIRVLPRVATYQQARHVFLKQYTSAEIKKNGMIAICIDQIVV
jgi:ASC-1-like (ASCH) protein